MATHWTTVFCTIVPTNFCALLICQGASHGQAGLGLAPTIADVLCDHDLQYRPTDQPGVRDQGSQINQRLAFCALEHCCRACIVLDVDGVLRCLLWREYSVIGQQWNMDKVLMPTPPSAFELLTVCPSRIDNQLPVGFEFSFSSSPSCVCHVKKLSNFQCLGHSKLRRRDIVTSPPSQIEVCSFPLGLDYKLVN